MAVKKSAKKRARKDIKRRMSNRMARSKVRTEVKKFSTINVAEVDKKEIEAKLVSVISTLDKASRKGLIHKNACARKKSRLIKALRKSQKELAEANSPKKDKNA